MAASQILIMMSPEDVQALVTKAVDDALDRRDGVVKKSKKYMDTGEIAEHFGVHADTVRTWVNVEKCPHVSRGKLWRFELAAVEAWFRGRTPGVRAVK